MFLIDEIAKSPCEGKTEWNLFWVLFLNHFDSKLIEDFESFFDFFSGDIILKMLSHQALNNFFKLRIKVNDDFWIQIGIFKVYFFLFAWHHLLFWWCFNFDFMIWQYNCWEIKKDTQTFILFEWLNGL